MGSIARPFRPSSTRITLPTAPAPTAKPRGAGRATTFAKKSASETKTAELASALIRIADREGAPLTIGVDQLRQASPRLTPLAIGQMFRKHHDELEAALLDRGYTLVGYSDQGPRRGIKFEIGVAE